MKHRSVIGFVIVAAALFSLPQLSHDLRELKGAVGSRLHRELLYAFLNLPAGEPTAAPAPAPAALPSESLVASCPEKKAGAAKTGRAEASGRAEGRTSVKVFEQDAMLGDPKHDPINEVASVEAGEAFGQAAASLSEARVASEVAMLIPPEAGVDPSFAPAPVEGDALRVEADKLRVEAEGRRVAYTTARFEEKGPEWQKVTDEAMRQLKSLPGTLEFRVMRDGARVKVLKIKCGECPPGAPRTPPAPRHTPAPAPSPAVLTSAEWSAGE